MPLKKSSGNMYEFVTHTHSHLGGECPHRCSYCYVQKRAKRFPSLRARYSGPVRLIEKELGVNYGKGKTIFIEHMNDLYAVGGITSGERIPIFDHLEEYPNNVYVFQSKHPPDPFVADEIRNCDMIGTTLECNQDHADVMGVAPDPIDRKQIMVRWKEIRPLVKRFVTIEPVLDFDVAPFALMIQEIEPAFVNIGADSKGTDLPEPSAEKLYDLAGKLQMAGMKIRHKRNLDRLLNKP